MKTKLKQIIHGIASYVPGLKKYQAKGTGGSNSARYCYSIWLRHLVMARNNGLDPYPKIVAELGPGDSLGIGLAALISGADKYFAFDVVEHANTESNIKIFDELVTLFRNRENIPREDEFPMAKPLLKSYDFPSNILNENILEQGLKESRIKRIRGSISNLRGKDSLIEYKVPWDNESILKKESVDMIYSQAVLEHISDLRNLYKTTYLWLKPTGYVSHQIDFKCHDTADEWNGHWTYSDFMWKLISGKRAYLTTNRQPHSTHIKILLDEGYKIVCDIKNKSESKLTLDDLAPKFRSIPKDDLTTSGVFIQAVKVNYPCQ